MQIKPGALKPGRNDRSTLSLIRMAIGVKQSRAAAIEHVHGKDFWGFGAAEARILAEHCDSLSDDRAAFCGHAEMSLGYEIPPGPPNTPPEMTAAYEAAMSRLISLSKAFAVTPDANP